MSLVKTGARQVLPRGMGWLRVLRQGEWGPVAYPAVLFTLEEGRVTEVLTPGALGSKDRLLLADEEAWMIDVGAPTNASAIVGFIGGPMDTVTRTWCTLSTESGEVIAEAEVAGGTGYCAGLLARIYSHRGQWKFHALGLSSYAKNAIDLLPDLHRLV